MSHDLIRQAAPLTMLLLASACADATSPSLTSPYEVDPMTSAAVGTGSVLAGAALWLRADAGIGVADGAAVSVWRDQSGHQRDAQWNAGNAFGELAPTFRSVNTPVNLRPSVRFEGQHALEVDLTFLGGSDYTIIAVNGRDRTGFANFWLAGESQTINDNLVLGYERTDLLRQSHFGNDLDAVVEDYTGTEIWSLDTYFFDQHAGRAIYHNGAPVASDASLATILSNPGTTLGHFRAIPSFFFQGDLGDVIVFDRALTAAERLAVETALAQRYGFSLSIAHYVPCAGPWSSHAEYVSAHLVAVRHFVDARLLTKAQGKAAQAAAEASACGS